MNFLSFRALWKGIKGQSIVFSLVYAMAVMGLSFAGTLRESLRFVGLWGPLIWIFPIFFTGWLAKNESKLKLSLGFRRTCSYGLIIVSSLLAYSLWKYEKSLMESYPQPEFLKEITFDKEPRRRLGPRGK